MSCHKALKELKGKTDLTIALAGNPNVGKSCVFNQLTGLSVVTANYPGKTVELNMGVTLHNGTRIGIIDLPGTYALSAVSDDQLVARRGVLEGRPDIVVVVVDASNLQRNLYMVLQFLELGFPVVVGLNLVDYAAKIGLKINHEKLSELLGTPVVPTVAVRGQGIDELIHAVVDLAQGKSKMKEPKITYGRDVEGAIQTLGEAIQERLDETPYNLPARALAIQLLENDVEFVDMFKGRQSKRRRRRQRRRLGQGQDREEFLKLSARLARQIEEKHGEPVGIRIARERHGLAGTIADAVQTKFDQPILLSQKLKHYTVAPYTGIPLMVAVMLGIFAFIFYVGGWLSAFVDTLWVSFISSNMGELVHFAVKNEILANVILWGVDKGILAWLSVGVPYILTFYIVLSFLEDSGYLNSMAFLMDNVMHKLGLHGRSIIPILTGAGCNVPAIMGTRVLTTKRKRILASTLVVLVPCSARTAVILGAVASFVGWTYALLIYVIELMIIGMVGWGLHRLLPGESSGLVMEMFPFRFPSASVILKKTWFRFRDFAYVAFPVVTVGSLALGALYETGYLSAIAEPLSPIVYGVLGLPAVAGICLILGILRKELTLELLVALAIVGGYGSGAQNLLAFMTPIQIFIFALVVTIYIPCVATVAVLGKELGWRNAFLIMVFTIVLAIAVGGIAYRVVPYLGLSG
ncbi:MAG: ferrous iron transport protein B [Candidatus Bathyarchaeota archaeon]|nr:MAG: ferrous iron transport protein B [Candidatus Bathyarchaeota archaeon]